jgi:WhiB family redox-sensing transcriptional regulator
VSNSNDSHPVISFTEWEIATFVMMLRRQRPPWMYDALCNGEPTELWFAGQGQSAYAQRGLEICRRCPVRKECFTYAMENPEVTDTWGGSTSKQRSEFSARGMEPEEAYSELLDSETIPS